MKRFLSKLRFPRIVAVLVAILLVLFLVRPGVSRWRWRATQSISQALGRRVQIGDIRLRFLPQLGFELDDFSIFDDPSFGAEPLLRAPSVNATVRLTALIRGRLEISSLSFNEASLNLTRNSEGQWNLQDLLERTSRISTAPTSARKAGRATFPYIEAEKTRINFKLGPEKTHFALTEAQFAFWQETENAWGMRLKARPIRTDANLTDTGIMNISGLWQRSAAADQTPISITFQWKQAQIGQVSKLISGADKGWRGSVLLSGSASGTPANLTLAADASIDDFRRFEVMDGDDLQLAIHCAANYSPAGNSLSALDCKSLAGNGYFEATGNASLPSYEIKLSSNNVPAASAMELLRHIKTGLPQDLDLDGLLNSTLHIRHLQPGEAADLRGDGEIEKLILSNGDASAAVHLERVPFTIALANNSPVIDIGPVNAALAQPQPLQVHASLNRFGYRATVRGEAGLKRLFQAAQILHIPVPAVSADGTATADVAISGDWADSRPLIVGNAQLHNVFGKVRGLNSPLEIRSANLALTKDAVRVQNLIATAADAQWKGSLIVPRPCPTPRDCTLQFNLHAQEVSAASLNKLLNPAARKQPWYNFLSLGDAPVPYLLQANAVGKVSIEQMALGTTNASQVTADITLADGQLTLANLRAGVLGGRISGDWKADFAVRPPSYSGRGEIESASLASVAALMHDDWMDGSGSARYEFNTAGRDLKALLSAADLSAEFTIQNGHFPRIALGEGTGQLRATVFSGNLILRDGLFSLDEAKLAATSGVYSVSGTVSLAGALNMQLIGEGANRYDVSGTLTRTRVSPARPVPTRASIRP